jgi:hypothetical protein
LLQPGPKAKRPDHLTALSKRVERPIQPTEINETMIDRG